MPKVTRAAQPTTVINLAPQTPETPEPEKPQEREEKEPGWFISDMMKIPANEWEKIYHLELQRLEPKVPGVAGSKGYLWTFFAPITYADVKKRWGGGKFRMDLCKNGHYFKTHNFDIEGDPIYDRSREIPPATASNGNGNGSLDGNVLKVLEQQNERLYQVLTTLQGAKEENPAVGSAVEMLTSAYKTGLSAVATGSGGSTGDATKQLEVVLSLAEKILSVRGGGGGSSLTEAITLLSGLGVLQKPKTLAEQIADAKALQELVGGGSEPKDWKTRAVDMVAGHLPEILDTLKAPANAAQARAAEANARARTAETLRTVPIHQPHAQPASQPAAAPAATTIRVEGGLNLESTNAAPAVEVMPSAAPAPAPVTQEQYDEGMKVQVVNMMRYGASGSAIATFLEDVKPDLAKDLVNYPEQTITQFFSQDPILKLLVEDPRWQEVLADARAYLTEDEVSVN